MASRKNIPDYLLDRAAEVWSRAVTEPHFDNGDASPTGSATEALTSINAKHAISKIDDYPAKVEAFRVALAERLKSLRDNDGKIVGEAPGEKIYFSRYLSSDYAPDEVLAGVADAVGLPHSSFPWKSDVAIREDCIQVRLGYFASPEYHYRLADGSWLVCGLSGPDMPAIISAVEQGALPSLKVERAVSDGTIYDPEEEKRKEIVDRLIKSKVGAFKGIVIIGEANDGVTIAMAMVSSQFITTAWTLFMNSAVGVLRDLDAPAPSPDHTIQ